MKATDIRTKSKDELNEMVLDLRKEQFNLRFQKSGGQLENTARMRAVRREIARIKTVLNEQGTTTTAAKPVKQTAKKAPAKAAAKKTKE